VPIVYFRVSKKLLIQLIRCWSLKMTCVHLRDSYFKRLNVFYLVNEPATITLTSFNKMPMRITTFAHKARY
jgi:hypothetical protein